MALLDRYKNLIKDLLPLGKAWPRSEDTFLHKFICSMAEEYARIHSRTDDLLLEADPRTANELLPDWERLLGLPDDCTSTGLTVQERRQQAHQKLTSTGGQSAAYFKEVAANLGFDVEITDVYHAFRAGQSRAGDRLTNELWIHWWKVEAPSTLATKFRAGQNSAGDPLQVISNQTLECTFNKLKPAQTKILFEFGT